MRDRLREMGCALGQGYLMARPLAPQAAHERLMLSTPPLPAAVPALLH